MLPNSISPALKSHLQAQLNFTVDLSRTLLDTAQQVSKLNLSLGQELIEQYSQANQQLLSAHDASQLLALAARQLPPGGDKLQRYQHQLSQLLSHAQVAINRTAETHLPETSRTAAAYADEVLRIAAEETEKATQRQRALVEKIHAGVLADGARQNKDSGRQTRPAH